MNTKLLEIRCKKNGLTCEVAFDGDEAINVIYPTAVPRKFGLVLLDMHMDRINGDAACRTLRDRGYKGPMCACCASKSRLETETEGVGGQCTPCHLCF